MTRYGFPLLIISLIVAIVAPVAFDFVASATTALAEAAAADIAGQIE